MSSKKQTLSYDNNLKQRSAKLITGNLNVALQKPLLDTFIQQAQLNPGSLSPGGVLQLQRLVGNQAIEQILAQTAKYQRIQPAGGLNQTPVIQRHRAEAQAYVVANPGINIAIPAVGPLAHARNIVAGYVNSVDHPEALRIGLRNAWNANNAAGAPMPLQIPLPPELNKPATVPAQQAARLGFFNAWLARDPQSTEHNIAQAFALPGGAVPPAANLVDVLTLNNSAAIGHDGGHFGFTLQALVAAHNPPPLYLSAWLWNRGMTWTQALNDVFITHILHTATITDVHIASPTFIATLNAAGANNLAAQQAAMAPGAGAPGGNVAREIRKLLNAGPLSFTWNGVTLHR